jgi:SSS family solute:Na+ symporter
VALNWLEMQKNGTMAFNNIDWTIILIFLIVLTIIGLVSSRKGGKDSASFFLSGRNMPWWLLGISMVATTFSLGTPNLVTDIVRSGGVARNWLWWSFLLTGMLSVFVYAKLWSRSKLMTDLEFYEVRYSGKTAAILRGFRAIYLGFFYNVLVLASASLAFIKITTIMLGGDPLFALISISILVLVYSTIGGLKSILWTDFFQFIFATGGAILTAYLVINSPEIGGISNLIQHEAVHNKLRFLPDFTDTRMLLIVFVIPLTIQWWAAWYPGSEPGGGGYIAQRMLSAKSEKHAVGATLIFNFFHYAIRPWPWILVGLSSLIIFPDLQSMAEKFQNVPEQYIQNDIAYPAMLREFLPPGILGLVFASLIAAYMSTVSTHINWGASYLVNDFYARFINPKASETRKVAVGRLWTIGLLIFSVILALYLQNALQVFQYLLMIGAGTGLIYILRWFWWRINAWSEISAMAGATIFSAILIVIEQVYLVQLGQDSISLFGIEMERALWDTLKFVLVVLLTTIVWLIVTLSTKPCAEKVLVNFYLKVKPGGPGWNKVMTNALKKGMVKENNVYADWDVPLGLLCMSLGCIAIFGFLFAIGYLLYGELTMFYILLSIAIISSALLFKFWGRLFHS